jgi:hypothetical protein
MLEYIRKLLHNVSRCSHSATMQTVEILKTLGQFFEPLYLLSNGLVAFALAT